MNSLDKDLLREYCELVDQSNVRGSTSPMAEPEVRWVESHRHLAGRWDGASACQIAFQGMIPYPEGIGEAERGDRLFLGVLSESGAEGTSSPPHVLLLGGSPYLEGGTVKGQAALLLFDRYLPSPVIPRYPRLIDLPSE